jgi:hypothetical protein
MTDDEYREPDPHEVRTVLRQVAAYRKLCEQVRRKSIGTLVYGAIMLAIWYFVIPNGFKFNLYGVVFLGLALLELCVGLLNRFWPTAEGLILEGLVLMVFGGWNVVREVLGWLKVVPGPVSPFFVVFGILWAYQGIQTIRSYFFTKRAFPVSPNAEDIRWFDGLVRELRDADPRQDPRSLAIPTDPFLTGKLLGDSAFFLEPSDEVLIVARSDVHLDRVESEDRDRPPRGYLMIEGIPFPPFKLSDANWANYVAWKREGGEDPLANTEPPTVQPRR